MKIRIPKPASAIAENLAGEAPTSAELAIIKAKVEYITDPQLRPIDSFYHLAAAHVSLDTFNNHALADRWTEHRDLMIRRAQRQLVRAMQGRVVHDRLTEMEEIRAVRKNLLQVITPEVIENEDGTKEQHWQVEPKSLGEAVRSFRDMHILLELTRSKILGDFDAMSPEPAKAPATAAPSYFTREELATFARGLLERRGNSVTVIESEPESEEEVED